MISLGGLVSQRAFGKFEMGKVISNPFANAFIKEGEGEDHEVSMANNSIDIIIKMATELKAKMGEDEKQIPAWIQDHIAKAENLISQASGNYHEYGDSNESVVNEDNTPYETLMLIRNLEQTNKLLAQDLKTSKRLPNDKKENIKKSIVVNQGLINYYKETYKNLKNNESINEEPAKSTGEKIQNLNNRIKALKDKMAATKSSEQKNLIQQRLKNALQTLSNYKKQNISKESIVKEDSPCWKGYKQVGMKDKGGRQVPNCVPNESVIKEAGVPMYNAYLALSNKVRNLEDIQKELSKKYFAEKELNKKTTLLQQLKKGTDELKKWRARMAKVETDYIMNLDRDAEYSE